jgi:hypothetical protein
MEIYPEDGSRKPYKPNREDNSEEDSLKDTEAEKPYDIDEKL